MAQHLSRKELKKDEIRDTLVHGAEAALSHQRLMWILGALILTVALVVIGWKIYNERQTVKASSGLDLAMKIFQARIRTPGEPEEPGETTYVEEKNKYEDAAKKFGEVAKNYPRTRPAQVARYYAALCYERLGRFDEAQKSLREVETGEGAELASLARFNLAQILERTGKGQEAVRLYQQLMARPSSMVPRPLVMLALADSYRKNNPQEAQRLYNQIRTEYPDTAVAQAAQERLELLAPKSSS